MKRLSFTEMVDTGGIAEVYYTDTGEWDSCSFNFDDMLFLGTAKLEKFQVKRLLSAEFVTDNKEVVITKQTLDVIFQEFYEDRYSPEYILKVLKKELFSCQKN